MSEPVIRTPEAPASVDAGVESDTVVLKDLGAAVGAVVADVMRLLSVDARLCGHTVLVMIALTVIAALLLAGGWLLAATAAVLMLSQLESVSPAGAFLAVGGVHIMLAGLVVWRLRVISRDLTFQQSRASLHRLMTNPTTATGSCSDAGN
jgi:hypothetical protein